MEKREALAQIIRQQAHLLVEKLLSESERGRWMDDIQILSNADMMVRRRRRRRQGIGGERQMIPVQLKVMKQQGKGKRKTRKRKKNTSRREN